MIGYISVFIGVLFIGFGVFFNTLAFHDLDVAWNLKTVNCEQGTNYGDATGEGVIKDEQEIYRNAVERFLMTPFILFIGMVWVFLGIIYERPKKIGHIT